MHIAFKIISGLAKPGIEAFILIFIILKFSALFNHLEKSYRKQNNIRSFFAGYFLSCSGDGNEMRHLVSEKAIFLTYTLSPVNPKERIDSLHMMSKSWSTKWSDWCGRWCSQDSLVLGRAIWTWRYGTFHLDIQYTIRI